VRRLDEKCPHQVVPELSPGRHRRRGDGFPSSGWQVRVWGDDDAAFVRYAPILINAALGKGIGRAASNRRDTPHLRAPRAWGGEDSPMKSTAKQRR
jgi:hypothetical protein